MQDNAVGMFFLIFMLMLPVTFSAIILIMYIKALLKNKKNEGIKVDKEAL